MTTTPASRQRAQILQAGRAAAGDRRRADSQRCHHRVTAVIDDMRRRRSPLSNAEITRRARVNAQYRQRHRDLKLHAEQVRAILAHDTARQANIAQSTAELALRTETAMLIEQNHQLRNDLDAAHAELRQLRTRELATAATGILGGRLPADEAVLDLQRQLDELRVALHTAESDLAAARNLNQRLLVENTRLFETHGGTTTRTDRQR